MSAGSDFHLRVFANWLRKLDSDMDDIRASEVLWLAQRLSASVSDLPEGSVQEQQVPVADVAGSESRQGEQTNPKTEDPNKAIIAAPKTQPENTTQAGDAPGLSHPTTGRTTAERELFAAWKGRRGEQALSASTVRLPAVAALPNPLAIGRALRPLSRKFQSRSNWELDEDATAASIARSNRMVYAPVYRPAPERWFDLALVVEKATSMDVWQQTIIEFRRLLIHSGVFSDVRLWSLQADDQTVRLYSATGLPRDPRELMQSAERRLFLVVSDCVSEPWRNGLIPGLLAEWSRTTPLAVAQVLPRDMWFRTWLGEPVASLSVLRAGLPNRELRVHRLHETFDEQPSQLVAAPVFALEPAAISDWARTLMAFGGASVDGVLLSSSSRGELLTVDTEDAEFTARQRVDRFRGMVSPDAFRLGTYLSVAWLTVPVMRLIQYTMLPKSPNSILAEVILGSILERQKAPDGAAVSPDEVAYEFLPGVRDALQGMIRRQEVRRVVKCVSTFVRQRWGHPLDFIAKVLDADGDQTLPAGALPFARVAIDVMQLLRQSSGSPQQRDPVVTSKRRTSRTHRRYSVYFADKHNQWQVDCGAIHGLPTDPDKPVEFALYFESAPSEFAGVAVLTYVGAQKSVLELRELNADPSTRYQAELISLPVPPLIVCLEGDAKATQALEEFLSTSEDRSFGFSLVTETTGVARYTLSAEDDSYLLKLRETGKLIQGAKGYDRPAA
ncbi:MAG: SAV_2336 N-terminal domain-related protein, partial [Planctomycetota bacterium]